MHPASATHDLTAFATLPERLGQARVASAALPEVPLTRRAEAARPKLLERFRAKALELARLALERRWRHEREEGERFGIRIKGWQREREPVMER